MLLLELAINAMGIAIGTQINTNVNVVFSNAPLWFLLFAFLIVPINEELLFRGLMVPRLGIVVSALIFGALHASYNSTFAVEAVAACIFGMLSGYVYKKSGSLYPSILAHMLVNALAVAALLH